MNSIALSGLGLIVLYITLILQKSNKRAKEYLLAVVFLIIGFELLFRYLNSTYANLYKTWLVGLDLFYWVLFGPLIYLYVEFVLHNSRKFKLEDLIHFISILFLFLPYGSFVLTNVENIGFFTFISKSNLIYRILIFIWDYITPVYFIFIVLKLLRHKKNVRYYFSNLKRKDLRWLFYLSGGYLVYLIVSISLFIINQYLDYKTPVIDVDISVIPLSIYVFGLGIYGYKQESIFSEDFIKELRNGDEDNKYYRSGLSHQESTEIIYKIKTIMSENKPYLNSYFNIRDLAKLANTTIHKLSQVINQSFHKNFYELINEYRIKEVERMLKDPSYNNLKIISIAYDCGFNSKSAFYTAFKQYTGVTPTEYRKKLHLNNEQFFLN